MKAKVLKEFQGVRPGQVHPETIRADEVIDGDLAEVAVKAGLAAKIVEESMPAPKPTAAKKSAKKG